MTFRREFDSAGDRTQRARCAAALRFQLTRFSFWISKSRIGAPIPLLILIFFAESTIPLAIGLSERVAPLHFASTLPAFRFGVRSRESEREYNF